MSNNYFEFKQFTIHQDQCSMKVTTDACLFGAWVSERLKQYAPKYILDIGSGTGLLTLMLAQEHPDATIEAMELQKADFVQSKQNAASSPWNSRLNFVLADASTYLFSKQFDIIISNPPFYENDLKGDDNGKNIAHHDAGLGLETLIQIISRQLTPVGKFYLLLPLKRHSALINNIEHSNLFINHIAMVHQSENHTPFRLMIEGSFSNTPLTTETIHVKMAGTYSKDFADLLHPYYLHL
ncbi:MAG: tRNA1(Val) (adenine(37)-N6)-methyltransferase [Niabella sp.]